MSLDRRLVPNWLGAYLDLTSDLEAKESLHLWTGFTVLASALRRKIYLDMEHGRVFPNLYVIIVAESAKARKSAAMDYGRNLLIDALPEIRIMRDSMTSQGLIKALNHKVQVVHDGKIREELRSDVSIFADEVANLFSYEKTRAAQMVIFLTRTYTCPAIYDHTTVRDSLVRLYNLYPVLLGGTDPRNLKVLPEEAVGGLTGRLIWVIATDRRANNSGWRKDRRKSLAKELLREYLIHDLQRISHLQGEMQVTDIAQEMYDEWYNELSTKNTKDPATDAFYHRCHTTALQIAMLMSISERDDLVVTPTHIRGAIALVEEQLPEVKRVSMWSGGSLYEQHRAKLLHYMQNQGGLALRRPLLKYMGMQAEDFEKLLTTLVQDGSIEPQAIMLRQDKVYKLTKDGYGKAIPLEKTVSFVEKDEVKVAGLDKALADSQAATTGET